MSEPRNRKERRAASKIKSADEIPLKKPDRSSQASRTLLDIATEHRAQLTGETTATENASQPQLIHTRINKDGSLSLDDDESESEDAVGALGNALLYGISLAMVHFTLDVLVHNQYAERFEWRQMAPRAGVAMLIMSLVVFIMHPRADSLWAQAVFLAGSVATGCYLVHVSSTYTYLAVMSQAPPLGVLWIYSVVEQRLEIALVGLALVGGYFFWGGYSILS